MTIQAHTIWVLLRILLGWLYLWAFLDKAFGLGFATPAENAWISGGSPTYGYLMFATKGPFVGLYQALAESAVVEWLFMLGILSVGVSLVFGVFIRLGALAGAALSLLFYTSGFIPPEHNPLIDDHIINAVLFVGIYIIQPRTRYDIEQYLRKISLRDRGESSDQNNQLTQV